MATTGLTVTDHGAVRVLTMAVGPSGCPAPNLRVALLAALQTCPPAIRRLILASGSNSFSSGLPLEPDRSLPTLAALCAAIETSAVPVVAALHGLVLGPGAELAMAARGRVAAPGSRIGFAELALGLCAEGGTSRRLACRVGTAAALDLMLSGRVVAAGEALKLGLIDAVSEDPLAFAMILDLPVPAPAVPRAEAAMIARARRSHQHALPAAGRIIACIEAAALLPPDRHQDFEAVAREDLEASPEAAALRWVAKAERRAAAMPPAIARQRPAAPDRLALHGAGPEIVTLARLGLASGMKVAWHHPDQQAAAASLAALDLAETAEQRAGRLDAAARAAGHARLTDGGEAPIHVHAEMPEAGLPAGPVRLVLGEGGRHPGLALAPQGAWCELSLPLGEQIDGEARAAGLALVTLRRLGLQPVLVGGRPILGRGLITAGRTALAVLAQAVPRSEIARALEGFGVPIDGPLPEVMNPGRVLGRDEILARWLGALANEGFRLMGQGIARRPSDIDLLLVQGHGFPRALGGPMHQAERRGLMALRADLRRWAAEDPLWIPAAQLDRLIRDGQSLEALC